MKKMCIYIIVIYRDVVFEKIFHFDVFFLYLWLENLFVYEYLR